MCFYSILHETLKVFSLINGSRVYKYIKVTASRVKMSRQMMITLQAGLEYAIEVWKPAVELP